MAPVFQQAVNVQPNNTGAATGAATPQAMEEEPDLEADKGIIGFFTDTDGIVFLTSK